MIKILLVGFDEHIEDAYVSHLTDDQFDIDCVSTGICGLGRLRNNLYDVAVLSGSPPDMEAGEMCWRHRQVQ